MPDDEQRRIFAKNLLKYLEKKNKTQKEVADAIQVSPQTFNTWCQGIAIPRMGKIQLLADYFGIGKSDLLDDKSNDENYYLDKDSAEAAQFLFENPEYKVLFDASRKVKPEDINFVAEMIERMSKK